MPRKLIEDHFDNPVSPLIDVVMNAFGALFIFLMVYLFVARPLVDPVDPPPLRPAAPQPPIITLSEATGFSFRSGNDQLSVEFGRTLTNVIVPEIRRATEQYGCMNVDVIGHTDSAAIRGASNLDDRLLAFIDGTSDAPLVAGSNADLGLMRAWSVIAHLRDDPRLQELKFFGYSAGQTIHSAGRLSRPDDIHDESTRRRIEIRVRCE